MLRIRKERDLGVSLLLSYWIGLITIFSLLPSQVFADSIRRSHLFSRAVGMGDAFTALADGESAISYNPAGILVPGAEWTLNWPIAAFDYNKNIEENYSSGYPDTLEEYNEYLGLRFNGDFQSAGPLFSWLYFPDDGIFAGIISVNGWADITFPDQAILPVAEVEVIVQGMSEFGYAMDLFDTGVIMGVNLKLVKRYGLVDDVSVFQAIVFDNDEEALQDYLDENIVESDVKIAPDIGFLYNFDLPWSPRIGISALDVGDVDFGGAGETKQFNSVGVAVTNTFGQLGEYSISADYHDFTHSYFNHQGVLRRLALGFEIGTQREVDTSRFVALQLGMRDLQPSVGFTTNLGFLDLGAVLWYENTGTEETPVINRMTMIQINMRI